MAENSKNIAYAHDSHRAFNARFESDKPSKPRDIAGPWLSNEAVTNLPRARGDFERTREPANQPGHQRTSNETARGSNMVKQDRPYPAPHPTGPMGAAVDRQSFKERWLAEQRDAVLSRAAKPNPNLDPQRELSRVAQEPSR